MLHFRLHFLPVGQNSNF